MIDSTKISFDPVAGLATLGELNAWGKQIAGVAPGHPRGRIRMDAGLLAQSLLLVLAEAELVGALALAQPPNIGPTGIPLGLVLGERYAAVKASKAGPNRDAYMATMALARWYPDALSPAYKNDLEFIPSGVLKQGITNAAGIVWQVAAVGIPLAAIAALAWWQARRVDAEASVQVATIQATVAMDGALKYVLGQQQTGQPIDPAVIAAFKAAGEGKEESRVWGVPLVAGVGALGLVGGGVMAYRMTSDRHPVKP